MEVSGAVSVALDPSAAKAVQPRRWFADPLVFAFTLAALLLGGLRFLELGRWSLWLDEALTLADTHAGGLEVNPIGYWVSGWFYGGGHPDEFLLRLPAAIFGLASILATLWAFRPFVGARVASLAAFFLAASVWHLYWSQTARFYTLAQTLALLGGGWLLRGLYGGSSRRTLLGLVLLVLAALTHPSAAFLIGALLVVPWIARWCEWVPGPAAQSRAWTLFFWVGLLALVAGSGWVLRAWFRWEARQGGASPLHFVKTVGYLISPTLGLAFALGAWRQWRRRESFALVGTAVLALSTAGLASCFVRVSAQYVFVLQPWLAVCAALLFLPAEGETDAQRKRHAWLALVVSLPGLIESALYFTVRHGDRPQWREAYACVFERRAPSDLVLGMDAPVAEYYLDPHTRTVRDWKIVTWLDDWRARVPLDSARYERRTWFVLNRTQLDDWTELPTSAENRAEFERLLREECELVATFEVPLTPRDLDVFVYVTKVP